MQLIRDWIYRSRIFSVIAGCMLLVSLAVIYNLDQANKTFKQQSDIYLHNAESIQSLSSQLGYGGFIHAFKNYLLRGEERYYLRAVDTHQKTHQLLSKLKSSLSEDASQHINTIEKTLETYRSNLETVRSLRDSKIAIENIDQIVKVDDTQALHAIASLNKTNRLSFESSKETLLEENRSIFRLTSSIFIIIPCVLFLYWQLQTKHRHLEQIYQSLEKREEENRNLFDAMPDALICVDTSGSILELNKQAETLTGFPKDELLNHKIEVLIPDKAKQDHRNFRQTYTEKPVARLMSKKQNLMLKSKSGALIPVEISLKPITIEGRSVVYTYIRNNSEKQQMIANAELQNKRLEIISDAINIVFWMSTPGVKEMLFVSKGYEKIWQRSVESLYETPSSFTDLVHPDDKPRVFEELQAHAEGHWNIKYRIVLDSGEEKWILDQGFPIYEDDKLVALTGVASDITVLRNAEDALRNATETLENEVSQRTKELQASNAELEQFAYIASHDLQEPLRKIASFGTRLEKMLGNKLDEKEQQYFNIIVNASQRMKVLIEDLLKYSRLTTQKASFDTIDVNEVIRTVLDDMQILISEIKPDIEVGNFPPIVADRSLIYMLIHNLVSNAIKFRATTRQCKIGISYQGVGHTHIISVKDNGIGISPQYRKKIFKIFERLHGRSEYEGTGIGLALCERITSLHRGSISCIDNASDGITFIAEIDSRLRISDD